PTSGVDRILRGHAGDRRSPVADGGARRPRPAAGAPVSPVVDRMDVRIRLTRLVLDQEHGPVLATAPAGAAESAGAEPPGPGADRPVQPGVPGRQPGEVPAVGLG